VDRQKKLFDEFLVGLSKDNGKSVYGKDFVLDKLKNGQINKVLISSKRNDLYILASDYASNKGSSIEIISSGSDSGSILDTAFDGMVAIARY